MRMIFCGLSLALLAACGDGASTTGTGNDGTANGAVAAPAANAAAPTNSLADLRRADEVNECIQDVANELPSGTDVNAFCNCAVDNMSQGQGERPAMEACAARMGINTEGM